MTFKALPQALIMGGEGQRFLKNNNKDRLFVVRCSDVATRGG